MTLLFTGWALLLIHALAHIGHQTLVLRDVMGVKIVDIVFALIAAFGLWKSFETYLK